MGVSPPFGGNLLWGSYAARARADIALFLALPTATLRISSELLCVPAHPPRFRARGLDCLV